MTAIGDVLGSYKVTAILGRGGMGEVYVAEHQLLGRRAAIKVLKAELSKQDETVERFFNEARAATMIKHPGIVEIYDFGHAADGSAYLVMELLEGESLRTRLDRERKLRIPVAMAIARQVASAIAAAHDKGIVHRDLKPDNIFLVANPDAAFGFTAKVLDFGIAKLRGPDADAGSPSSTQTGALLGTPLYMSPEQCRGVSDIDHRADVYALGCILFHLVTGRPPFLGEGLGDIIGAHIHLAPPTLRSLSPRTPTPLDQLVGSLLIKDRARRPATMAQVARSLEQLLATPQLRDDAPTVDDAAPTVDDAALGLSETVATQPDAHAETAATPPSATVPSPPFTTLREATGQQAPAPPPAPPRPPSRRALLIGGGATLVAGVAGGAFLVSRRGGGAARKPRTIELELEYAGNLASSEISLIRTGGKAVPVEGTRVQRRMDQDEALAVVIVVQCTERFLGNTSYERDPDDQMAGLGDQLGDALARVPGSPKLIGYNRTAFAMRALGPPESHARQFVARLELGLDRAYQWLADTPAASSHVIVICDPDEISEPARRVRHRLGERLVNVRTFTWQRPHRWSDEARGIGVTKEFAQAKDLGDQLDHTYGALPNRWIATLDIDEAGVAPNSSLIVQVSGEPVGDVQLTSHRRLQVESDAFDNALWE